MKLIRNAVAVGAIATAALVACSTNTGSSGPGSSGSTGSLTGAGNTATSGTISMHLTIGSGVNLYARRRYRSNSIVALMVTLTNPPMLGESM